MVLPKIISPLQCAFVPNRDFHDNILIDHEILTTLEKDALRADTRP